MVYIIMVCVLLSVHHKSPTRRQGKHKMTTRIWQEMAKVGVVVLSMGLMTGTAQANNPATWDFGLNTNPQLTGVISTATGFLVSEGQTNSLASGVPTATATAWSN